MNHKTRLVLIGISIRTTPLLLIGLILYFMNLMPKNFLFYLILPISLLMVVITYFTILILLAGLVVRLYGPIKEGEYFLNSKEVGPWFAQSLFIETVIWVQKLFRIPNEALVYLFRIFLKSKIGNNITLAGKITDPSLTDIGEDVIIGGNAFILGHFMKNKKVLLKKVKIGNNCTIGINSTISPGVSIGDNTIVGAHSFVPKNKKLEPNSIYIGVPAKKLKKITR